MCTSKMLLLWISIVLAWIFPSHVGAQPNQIRFEHLTPEDGVAHMNTYDAMQDRRGFIWFATAGGVDRYDGYTFKNYRNIWFEPNSISNNAVTSLHEDRRGNIWIGTADGLNKLDPVTNKITRYKPPSTKMLSIWSVCEDRSGVLWLGTLGHGLFKFDPIRKKFTHFAHDPQNPYSLSHDIIRAICLDQDGALWIGTPAGLDRAVLKTSVDTFATNSDAAMQIKFIHYRHDPGDSRSLSSDLVEAVYADRQGVLWIGTAGGGLNQLISWENVPDIKAMVRDDTLQRRRPVFKRFTHNPRDSKTISENYVTTIFEDRQGLFWIGTANGGLNILSPREGRFYHYEMKASEPNTLNDNFIHKFCEDRVGTIWIATHSGGINKYSREHKKFTQLLKKAKLPQGIESNSVCAVIEDKSGDLWVSLEKYGLAKYDRKHQKVIDPGSLFDNTGSMLRMPTPAMCRDDSGVFWLGTWGDGLRKFDPSIKRSTFYRHNPADSHSLSDNRIVAVYVRSDGTIWITTQSGGINEFDPRTNHFTRYMHDPKDPNSISSNSTHCIYEDRSGVLWIGTVDGGLSKLIDSPFDTLKNRQKNGISKSRRFRRYQHDPQDTTSIGHNTVIAILQDSKGNLWVGTLGGGLDKLDAETDTFQHFTERNGYPFSTVTHILEDEYGNLWVSTTKGLTKFNEQGLDQTGRQFHLYDATDGLQGNLLQPVQAAAWRSPSGEMFLTGYNGITAFYPDQIQNNTQIPPIVITEFNVFDKPAILDTSIIEKKAVTLSYKDNVFSFEFAALNYIQSHKNQYAYKLEGFDKDWVYSGNRRRATYTHLDPGKYTFRVKGSNNDGVWNEEGTSVQIIITPPFWQTWWFRIAAALAVIAFLTILYNYRVSKLLEIERTRIRIARDLHDEVGSSLSSIALTAEMLQKEIASDSLVNRQLARVHETAQKLSRNLKEIVWAIDPHRDKFDDLLLHIKEAAEELLGQKGIIYTLDVPQDALPQSLKMEFRRNLFLIYKEMLHNVIKHAEATRVEIALTRTNGVLQLQVADNGKGFGEEKPGNGSGLKSMRARAGELNGRLEIESQPERGTKVTLLVNCK